MDESLREVRFLPVDEPLREDVHRLGVLVGEVIRDQAGEAMFQRIEALRRAAITRRERGEPLAALERAFGSPRLEEADVIVRAFNTYFAAVNLAERVHRIRRRRDYERRLDTPQPGGLADAIALLKTAGVEREALWQALSELLIEPVFTAHPTEAVRRSLLEKEREIAARLIEDLDRTRTPRERKADQARIRMALTSAWQTADLAPRRPSVAEELEHVSFYLSESLYAVIPVFYEVLSDALAATYGEERMPPPILRFATWVGGDMDGNPEVAEEHLLATLGTLRQLVLKRYRSELDRLYRLLSQSLGRIGVSPAVLDRIAHYRERFPECDAAIPPRHRDMPYRALIAFIGERIERSLERREGGYGDAREFLADLSLIGESLLANRGRHAGYFAWRRLYRRAQTFGFHLARLDVRIEAERVLKAALAARGDAGGDREALHRLQTVFAAIGEGRRLHGDIFGPFILSGCRSAEEVLAALELARRFGPCEEGRVALDLAPLFERIEDLRRAPCVLAALLDDPDYRAHLRERRECQVVMLGYSDSAKDGGILAARHALRDAELSLTALAEAEGISILFFHGRGGTVSRGGGKTARAVLHTPTAALRAGLRFTEQGEVIHRNYGLRALALRSLEQMASAALRNRLRPPGPRAEEARHRDVFAALAEISRERYRALIEDADFFEYFRAATPIDVIERLRMASRPPARDREGGFATLRAIPWVFAWSQNRSGLTAWYGVSHALEEALARFGLSTLTEMAERWPFFAQLLDDIEMVLAKSDLAIFERYSELAGPRLHRRFFPHLAAAFRRTAELIPTLRGQRELLALDPRLRQSIRLRNPYIDPIHLVQLSLLPRWRRAGRPEDALFNILASSVNGIAAGLQNTG